MRISHVTNRQVNTVELLDTELHGLTSAIKDMGGILSSILKVYKPVYFVILTMW